MNDVSSYLQFLMEEAIRRRVSDIHIEPTEQEIQIRFRIDGLLSLYDRREESWGLPVISKLKLLGGLDIGERRLPQDGSFIFSHVTGNLDVRLATLPTIYGEKVVLRLLTRQLHYPDLHSLGLDDQQIIELRKLIHSPQGMIIATGPTGSGKTTTLYALLQEIQRHERNIIALEDPVEYHVAGVNQVQVNPRAGLTFTSGLRALLRQDPDVILVGEIRDKETAEIAIRAALTGHLVLSSLHCKDAISAIIRLIDMGIEPYLITSALSGIVAQRLIRKRCTCQQEGQDHCTACNNTGYYGREAVFEVLPILEDLHPFINHRAAPAELRRYLRNRGFRTLNMTLKEKVGQGILTLSEFQRVLVADGE
ncbi:MAG TPA: GspE/PulE family protein [Bacillota bacterium]|nr:GspE/PulE family protein [Bacillota bacterium]